eukprot:scaffold49311_cov33-Tisochrysis_lutea.AAC.2
MGWCTIVPSKSARQSTATCSLSCPGSRPPCQLQQRLEPVQWVAHDRGHTSAGTASGQPLAPRCRPLAPCELSDDGIIQPNSKAVLARLADHGEAKAALNANNTLRLPRLPDAVHGAAVRLGGRGLQRSVESEPRASNVSRIGHEARKRGAHSGGNEADAERTDCMGFPTARRAGGRAGRAGHRRGAAARPAEAQADERGKARCNDWASEFYCCD